MLVKFISFSALLFVMSCDKTQTSFKAKVESKKNIYAVHAAKPMIVRVKDEVSSKVMSLTLKYSGKSDFVKSLEDQSDSVQNLVISVLSDYKLKDLKTTRGKNNFQKNILTSLNEFVAENKFVGVELVGLKEI